MPPLRRRAERWLLRSVTLIDEKTRNAMEPIILGLIVARCNVIRCGSTRASAPLISRCGGPEPRSLPDSVNSQIIDFLEGRTDGEDLLHAMYDHIIDEPIPERMRALFTK